MEKEKSNKKIGRPFSIILKQTPDEIRAEQRRCKDQNVKYKLLAIIAYAEGKSRAECAQRVERSWKCVYLWIKTYHANGPDGLIDGRKAGNRKPRLSEAQQGELARKVGRGTPENNNIKTDISAPQWTGALIHDLIKRDYGIGYSRGHISKLMHRIGVSYIQTKGFYPEGDPEAARAFAAEIETMRRNLAEGEVLLYQDEAGITSTASLGRAWTTKGERRMIAQPQRKKERRTIMATIEPETGRLTQTTCKRGNSKTFIAHLKRVLRDYKDKQKIMIVLDNARFHKSKMVKAWLKENPKITLKFIPPYWPQLNVVERYWRAMRKNIAHNFWVKSIWHRLRELRKWSAPFKQPNPVLKSLCEI